MLDTDHRNNKVRVKTSLFVTFACERELETEHNCNILTPTLMAISVVSFSFSWCCSTGGPGAHSAGFLYYILSATSLDPNSSGPQGPYPPGFSTTSCLLTRLISNSNCASDSHTNLRALPVREVTHTLSSRFVSDYYDIWVTPPSASAPALTPASMLRPTNPCAEPKGSQPN